MPNSQAQQNTSASEQEWQRRLNAMDTAFNEASEYITQARTQMTQFKSTITAGGQITWAQQEAVDQLLARSLSSVYSARQSLPIGVSGSS